MQSFSNPQWFAHDRADYSPGERYTRALVELTQRVWQPDCTFDTALALVCEAAANALQVERVNVSIDTLKIVRSSVQDLAHDATDAAIVSAVFGLAQSRQIEVVAEGVERLEQQHAMQAIGVSHMQAMDQTEIRKLFEPA